MIRSGRRPVLLLVPLALLGAEAPGPVDAFYPLRVGNRWTYDLQRERTVAPLAGGAPLRSVFDGHAVSEILGNEAQGRRTVQVMRTSTTRRSTAGGEEERSQELLHLRWGGGGLVVSSPEESGEAERPAAKGRARARRPQLRLLDRKLEKGSGWRAGTLRIDRLEVRLEAEVVGREDVRTGSALFEDCVRVHYEGPVDGWIDSPDGPARIGWGLYQQEVWYARGVGVVQVLTRLSGEMVLPGSTLARFDEIERRRLETHVLR